MASVVRLADYAPKAPTGRPAPSRPADVIVLPVVRIERHLDKPSKSKRRPA